MEPAQHLHFSTSPLIQTKLLFLQSQEPATSLPLYKTPHRLTARELKDHYLSAIRTGLFHTPAPNPITEDLLQPQNEDVPCAC
jgi:hypothetical protein